MKRILVLLSLLVLFLGCATQHGVEHKAEDKVDTRAAQPKTETPEELDICEAVFRHQFEHNASGQQQHAGAYFLEILGKDPTEDFLARFRENRPSVKRGSEFVTGKGLLFRVTSIDRVDGKKFEVAGGYYEAGLSSSGNVYTVIRKGDQWVIVDDRMLWIS